MNQPLYEAELAKQIIHLLAGDPEGGLVGLFVLHGLRRSVRSSVVDVEALSRRLTDDSYTAELIHRAAVDVSNDQPVRASAASRDVQRSQAWRDTAERILDCGYIARANVFHDLHGVAWSAAAPGVLNQVRFNLPLETSAEAALKAILKDDEYYQSEPGSVALWNRAQAYWITDLSALLSQNEALRSERDEADRRAGAAERQLADRNDNIMRREQWLRSAKEQRGYDRNTSFDRVWAETCTLADRARTTNRQLLGSDWNPIGSFARSGPANAVIVAVPHPSRGWIVGEAWRQITEGASDNWWWAGTGPDIYHDGPIQEINHAGPTWWQELPAPPPSDSETNPTIQLGILNDRL